MMKLFAIPADILQTFSDLFVGRLGHFGPPDVHLGQPGKDFEQVEQPEAEIFELLSLSRVVSTCSPGF